MVSELPSFARVCVRAHMHARINTGIFPLIRCVNWGHDNQERSQQAERVQQV